MERPEKGSLFLVATPIGNLGDITLRGLDTLKSVDLIAAEDTRQTQKLLNHYAVEKPLTSYFEHNKKQKGPLLIRELAAGKNIALVSDAGLPGISDPGADLVKLCIEEKIKVTVIPGPSALLTGLVASGLDTSGFVFAGFFPRENKERNKLLDELAEETRTILFYESPHRLRQTVRLLLESWGNRRCCIARELTKVYEEFRRGTFTEVLEAYGDQQVKGEITLIIEGRQEEKKAADWEEIHSAAVKLVDKGYSQKEAAREVAQSFGVSRRELYNLMLKNK